MWLGSPDRFSPEGVCGLYGDTPSVNVLSPRWGLTCTCAWLWVTYLGWLFMYNQEQSWLSERVQTLMLHRVTRYAVSPAFLLRSSPPFFFFLPSSSSLPFPPFSSLSLPSLHGRVSAITRFYWEMGTAIACMKRSQLCTTCMLALFPGAEEEEEKECLVHTVCTCA